VEFLCGRRALADYRAKHDLVRGIAERASIQELEVGDLFERAAAEGAALRKRLRESEEIRLDFEAEELSRAAEPATGCRLVRVVRQGVTPDDLKTLALKLRARPGLVALLGSAAPDGRAHLVFARSDDVDTDVAAILKSVLPIVEGRGGGRPEMAQGSGPKADALAEALEAASLSTGDHGGGLA
jgi:alanyl-tRNA synthetase